MKGVFLEERRVAVVERAGGIVDAMIGWKGWLCGSVCRITRQRTLLTDGGIALIYRTGWHGEKSAYPHLLANPITGRRLRVLFGECSLEALREPLPFVWVAGYLRFTFLFSPTDMKMTASAHIAKDVVELGALRTLPLVAHCLSVYS